MNFLRYQCLKTGNVTKAPYLPYVLSSAFSIIFSEIRNITYIKSFVCTIVINDPKITFVLYKDRELELRNILTTLTHAKLKIIVWLRHCGVQLLTMETDNVISVIQK